VKKLTMFLAAAGLASVGIATASMVLMLRQRERLPCNLRVCLEPEGSGVDCRVCLEGLPAPISP